MSTRKIIFGAVLAIGMVVTGIVSYYQYTAPQPASPDQDGTHTVCTMDAKLCPDGSGVGRSGPECTFSACPSEPVPADVQAHIDARSEVIQMEAPAAGEYIASPLTIRGQARGTWYFEAGFTVLLVDWDGRIIAEHYVTAEDDWMSEDFVPFSGELTFVSPYTAGDPEFMQRGTLILQKANPSGVPENADALEIPVWFNSVDTN